VIAWDGMQKVIQEQGDVIAAEGDTVTLGCQYESSVTNNYLFWYKQDGNNSPKFILSRVSGDDGNTADEFKERFSSTLDSSIRSVPLKIQKQITISSAAVSDSAMYYCAVRPTLTGNSKTLVVTSYTKSHLICLTYLRENDTFSISSIVGGSGLSHLLVRGFSLAARRIY
uniref:Ig-like domain-containing protein n=1 Tax=Haplochromis burtoni TaxID=8153 RepID=A0A3Q2V2B3_HAPBU